jgi:hypothetical protein
MRMVNLILCDKNWKRLKKLIKKQGKKRKKSKMNLEKWMRSAKRKRIKEMS